jgi:hypothetical protein
MQPRVNARSLRFIHTAAGTLISVDVWHAAVMTHVPTKR